MRRAQRSSPAAQWRYALTASGCEAVGTAKTIMANAMSARPNTVLAGNHDLPYLARPRSAEFHWFRREADGFKPRAHEGVHEALKPLDMRLAWRRGRVLATHAGVTGAWAAYAGLSDSPEGELDRRLRESPMHLFDMAGPARGGRSTPSPVWADRTELEADPWAGWIQVVGHTPVPTVTNAGKLWFCDTWTDGDSSMLLLSDGGSFTPVRP